MKKQRICSYSENYTSGIVEKIRKDAELFKMSVKAVAISPHIANGYTTHHLAIVVFESEEEE